MQNKTHKFLLITMSLALAFNPAKAGLKATIHQSDYLSFQELEELANPKSSNKDLKAKLDDFLVKTLVGQTGFASKKKLTEDPRTYRRYFRVSHWNLERGYKLKDINLALNNTDAFIKANQDPKVKDLNENLIHAEAQMLRDTDIYSINEADIGVNRTDYKNTIHEFSKITKSGYYAFATEFIEIDKRFLDDKNIDHRLYKGLHGNAIVSKFPIVSTKVIPLPECYDWFKDELKKISLLEKIKRKGVKTLFKFAINSELRLGQRHALVARIDVPNSKEDVSFVTTHFENRCRPKCRRKQLKALLKALKDIDTPLILAGDLNNSEVSAEPTSFTGVIARTFGDWQNLARATATWFNPLSIIINPAFLTLNTIRKAHDPTVFGLPIFLRNKTADLFWDLANFEFNDGNMFDFSDAKKLCYKGKDGKLANSNQRVNKGFASTFRLMRKNILTHFRFDWIFVKSMRIAGCEDSEDDFEDIKPECKRFIPAFGRNLKALNESFYKNYPKEVIKNPHRDFVFDRLSDHDPITCKILL